MRNNIYSITFMCLVAACSKKTGDKPQLAAETKAPAAPAVAAPPSDQIAISDYMYFKTPDGNVKMWGDSEKELPGMTKVKQLAVGNAGTQTMCSVMLDGTVQCWGNGASGELGDGKESKSETPVVVPGIANASAVGVGGTFACALIGDGTVTCWGGNGHHTVTPDKKDKFLPPTKIAGVAGAKQIAVAADEVCALQGDGSVKCWGYMCGTSPDCETPQVVPAFAGATHIAASWQSICAVLPSSVACFGSNNEYGQLGNGTDKMPTDRTISTVKGVSGVKQLEAGMQHWCALMNDTSVQCWGSNEFGQLGDGQAPEAEKYRTSAAPVKGVTGVIAFACGSGGTCCAELGDKSLKCWGENTIGARFGAANAETTNTPTPVVVTVK